MDEGRRKNILERFRRHSEQFDAYAAARGTLEPSGRAVRPSPRELEVLQLDADGLPSKEIAERLHLSEETVKAHQRNMLARLHARNRAHAVAIGFRNGYLH
jgi:DNA-binding NarL/FixJ family response regulator